MRVSPSGDYQIHLEEAASFAIVGTMDDKGNLSQMGRTQLRGRIWLNESPDPSGRRLDIANMRLRAADFVVSGGPLGSVKLNITNTATFLGTRIPAVEQQDGTFLVAPGQVRLGIEATISGATGGIEFVNQGPFAATFDAAGGFFSFDGRGRNEAGQGAVIHIEGQVVNRPPIADPGPDRTVECQSPTTTPVLLDASRSRDPDVGDAISHFQWFEGLAGLSNQKTATVLATLGLHSYSLHVYDGKLGSGSVQHRVEVVDTTPPVLDLGTVTVCLWPPNHEFARFELGREIAFSLSDKCDANPSIQIIDLFSDEPANALGSGSTQPDVAHGSTAGCVRAERAGPGEGRTYLLTVQAEDHSPNRNKAQAKLRLLVPHDNSGHAGCVRAEGRHELDSTCFE
ncbi:MAG: hypothetical protein HYZ28_26920 [Myxococcales bacterium]|nr:hypothetical protein [Myxococcales bacterium]